VGKSVQLIETPRLVLRPFEEADLEAAFGWFGDADVMRFTPTGPDRSPQETGHRLARYRKHQAAHGFSKWAIVDRLSARLIGDSGLLVLPDLGWTDLGFRLSREYWGQGFATEAANAWARTAFENCGVTELGAFCHLRNVASLHVLAKIGFRELGRCQVMGMESIVFALVPDDLKGREARLTTG
jgi:RimJ/RimL family protein N-acetyltransferase